MRKGHHSPSTVAVGGEVQERGRMHGDRLREEIAFIRRAATRGLDERR